MRKENLNCFDCDINVFDLENFQFFMLRDDVWAEATKKNKKLKNKPLCISCTEKRLGRKLQAKDFTLTPLEMLEQMVKYLRS